MKKLAAMIVTGVLVCGMASSALAKGKQGEKSDSKSKLASVDTNGDKKISLEEFKAWQEKRAQKPASGKGKKGGKHAKGGKKQTVEERFKRADADHDGFLTKEELKALKKHHQKKGGKGRNKGGATAKP